MGDIKQAAIWLEAGHAVRRASWRWKMILQRNTGTVVWADNGEPVILQVSDYRADDYVIAQ